MNTLSGWEDILHTDEVIRWQGRPDPAVVWKWSHLLTLIFGICFSGIALMWMISAASDGGGFWMFGLLHFIVGIGIILGPVFAPPYLRRKTWYTLTNKRALIATNLPILGRKLKSYSITPASPLELETQYGTSVYFTTVTRRGNRGSYEMKVGFERIGDANHVFNLIREIQKEAT